jgi:preprotein translocase subunit SecD
MFFTKCGARLLASATEREKGLLTILINGKVVRVMGISRQIYDKATISGTLTKREAENLADTLNQGSAKPMR